MFYTSRRIKGEEAYEWGLADMLVPLEEVRTAATDLAKEISENSPLGVMETRATMRQGLADRVRKTTDHELVVQDKLCLLYTSPSPRDATLSRMPSSA